MSPLTPARAVVVALALLCAVVVSAVPGGAVVVDDPTGGSRVRRLAGDDRVATAVAVSRATFSHADTVVLATAAAHPDALSGSVLAAARSGPLLLTDPGRLPDDVRDELGRLDATRVVVLGGEAAIRPAVVAALQDAGVAVRRVAGATRYETAARVADELDDRSTVVLATGEDFPDAVAASAYAASRGWPVVLVGSGRLDPAVQDLLADGRTQAALPIGGPAAIGDDVLAQVRDTGVEVRPRLAGPTRWATSAAVARAHLQSLDGTAGALWLATGEAFPDALSAGAAAAAAGGVLQLTPSDRVDVAGTADDPRGVLAAERACGDGGSVASATLVGGPAALRPQVADQAAALLTCEPMPTRVVAAGDIAGCGVPGDEATARLLDGLHGTVAALGDLAYDRGTAAEFASCYGPSWGRHRDRTRPAIGNHDLITDGGAPYYDYFGAAAGPRGRGWYAFDLSDEWHAVVLNTNCWAVGGCGPGSPQYDVAAGRPRRARRPARGRLDAPPSVQLGPPRLAGLRPARRRGPGRTRCRPGAGRARPPLRTLRPAGRRGRARPGRPAVLRRGHRRPRAVRDGGDRAPLGRAQQRELRGARAHPAPRRLRLAVRPDRPGRAGRRGDA